MKLPKILDLKGVGIACAVAFVAGSWSTWKIRDWMAAEAKLKAAHAATKQVQAVRTLERRNVRAAADVGAKVEARTQAVRTVTKTIILRVPTYVSPAADARCIVPAGFVRAHDAAATGVPGASPSPGQPDEAPSGLALSTVAETVASNYGACHETREQVTGWQAFYRDLQSRTAGGR